MKKEDEHLTDLEYFKRKLEADVRERKRNFDGKYHKLGDCEDWILRKVLNVSTF